MKTAKNCEPLRRIKHYFNGRFYHTALRLWNEVGEKAAKDFVLAYFLPEVRQEMARHFFGGGPDVTGRAWQG